MNSHLSGTWKGIFKVASKVWQNISLILGNGRTIHFWKDHCCGEVSLEVKFPLIASAARNINSTV